MTNQNDLPVLVEACDENGDALGECTGEVQDIYMPQGQDFAASTLFIRAQTGLIPDDIDYDTDMVSFQYGSSSTVLTTVPPNGLQISGQLRNRKFGDGAYLGKIKATEGNRIVLLFID